MRSLKHNVPPYEVMRQTGAAARSTPRQEEQPRSSAEGGSGRSWHNQLADPVVLRVSRGVVILGMLGVIGLILLAYFVGVSRGSRVVAAAPPVQPPRVASAVVPAVTNPADPQRVRGMSYMVLVTYPNPPRAGDAIQAEIEALQRFLAEHGVDVTVESGNNNSLRVVDLRPFKDEEIGQAEYQRYAQRLVLLGQTWQTAQRGSRDFSSMICERY